MNLLTIQTLTDNTIVRSFVNYPTIAEATSALYSTMASACINDNVVSSICELIGDNGTICQQEIWNRNADSEEE